MELGLLWYDNSDSSLDSKVAKAAARYRERFGEDPTVCYVHPTMVEPVADIQIEPSPRILEHHLWLGREEKAAPDTDRESFPGAAATVLPTQLQFNME